MQLPQALRQHVSVTFFRLTACLVCVHGMAYPRHTCTNTPLVCVYVCMCCAPVFLAATVILLVLHQHQCAATEAHVDSFVAVFDMIQLAYMTRCL